LKYTHAAVRGFGLCVGLRRFRGIWRRADRLRQIDGGVPVVARLVLDEKRSGKRGRRTVRDAILTEAGRGKQNNKEDHPRHQLHK
jgi:hypothetical protein